MTVREIPARVAAVDYPAAFDRLLAKRFHMNWEVALYIAIFAAAFALRFWDLGARALHHDESIHAQWSWNLTQGDYTHSPVFHGPLYYHVQGLVFLIFGATDFTARISAAIFGMALVALPLMLRRWLGRWGTIAAVAFIAFSPTLVYYSRFFREDIYFAVFTLVMAVAMWRYLASGRDRWLVTFALAMAGSYATKEASYLTTAVFLLYINGLLASDLARKSLKGRTTSTGFDQFITSVALFPVAWGVAALWPFLGHLRVRGGWDHLPRSGDLMVILGTLTLPLLVPFLKEPLEAGIPVVRDLPLLASIPFIGDGIVDPDRLSYPAVCSAGTRDDYLILGGLFAVIGGAAAFIGLQWRPKTFAIAAGAAGLAYLTLMTSFWTNFDGLCTGPWGSLDYWLQQQDVKRGNQPWFYYHMLMPMYEFLPLVIAVAGAWWSVVRGNAFSRFLAFWVVATWIALSAAGEKMPWLNTHIALPTALLAGWTIQRAWRSWKPKRADFPRIRISLLSLALVSAGAMLVLVWGIPDAPFAVNAAFRIAAAGALAAIVAITIRGYGRRSIPTVLAVATIGALAFFSLQTMVKVTFTRGDVPDDLLIYTQSTPEIPRIADQIDDLADASGKGDDLRIAVDSELSWPWVWYLRDYHSVSYLNMNGGPPSGDFDVLLVFSGNLGAVTTELAKAPDPIYGAPIRHAHRSAFPELYKNTLPTGARDIESYKTIAEGIVQDGWLVDWFHFWRDKQAPAPFWDHSGAVFFPAAFDPMTGELNGRALETPEPGLDDAGNPQFGGLGATPGRFITPVDIETDAGGNLYVIDAGTDRIQKFDPAGNLIAAADIRTDPDDPNELAEPWGIEVAPDGTIIVADTFGWTMRVLDGDSLPVTTFGYATNLDDDLDPLELYGPRDVAIDADGRLWVTDTGNNRLVLYTPEGLYLGEFGGFGDAPGQFSEPTGIDIATDGTVLVADMYNARVQLLALSGAPLGEFPVDGWGNATATDKPYIRALTDGRIALSLPDLGEVRVYQRDGTLDASITGPGSEPLTRPYGVAEAADGRLWITEGDSARVRLLPIP